MEQEIIYLFISAATLFLLISFFIFIWISSLEIRLKNEKEISFKKEARIKELENHISTISERYEEEKQKLRDIINIDQNMFNNLN